MIIIIFMILYHQMALLNQEQAWYVSCNFSVILLCMYKAYAERISFC